MKTHYVTGRELAALTGWEQNTVRLRCRKANVPKVMHKITWMYDREKALEALRDPDPSTIKIAPDGYISTRELVELTGWHSETIRLRCRRANVPTIKRKDTQQRVYYFYKREQALAELHMPDTANLYIVPDGFISLPDLAELAECSKGVAHARLKRAGVEGKLVPRLTKAGGKQGGRKMYIFPQKEALEAVLQ
jgi:hypothetical protein